MLTSNYYFHNKFSGFCLIDGSTERKTVNQSYLWGILVISFLPCHFFSYVHIVLQFLVCSRSTLGVLELLNYLAFSSNIFSIKRRVIMQIACQYCLHIYGSTSVQSLRSQLLGLPDTCLPHSFNFWKIKKKIVNVIITFNNIINSNNNNYYHLQY